MLWVAQKIRLHDGDLDRLLSIGAERVGGFRIRKSRHFGVPEACVNVQCHDVEESIKVQCQQGWDEACVNVQCHDVEESIKVQCQQGWDTIDSKAFKIDF